MCCGSVDVKILNDQIEFFVINGTEKIESRNGSYLIQRTQIL